MNSEKYKCYAFDVGAELAFGKSEKLIMNSEKFKYDANPVGAKSISAQIKSPYGITIIALVITIIIMLILAAVTLTLTLGEHGIFKTAQNASKNYIEAGIKEENELAKLDNSINTIINNGEISKGQSGEIVEKPETPKLPENSANLYLYYKGYVNEEITGGFNTYASPESNNLNGGKVIIGKEYIELKTWSHWVAYHIKTEKEIDLTNYSKVKFEIFDSNWTENSGSELCTFICGGKNNTLTRENIKDGIYEIDISDLSGNAVIEVASANGGSMKIRAIWLEK